MSLPIDPTQDLFADVNERLSVGTLFDDIDDGFPDLSASPAPSSSLSPTTRRVPTRMLSPGLEDIDIFSGGTPADEQSAEIWGILKAQTGRLQAQTGRLKSLEHQVSFLKDEF